MGTHPKKRNYYDNKSFSHIKDVLRKLLTSYRTDSDSDMVRIWDIWDSALGETITANAQPAAFKNKVLIVHVASSSWIQQLQFLKSDIIGKLNSAAGTSMIKEIKFKIGAL